MVTIEQARVLATCEMMYTHTHIHAHRPTHTDPPHTHTPTMQQINLADIHKYRR